MIIRLPLEHSKLLDRAIEQYGREAQIEMIIEECAELIQALQKLKRKPNDIGRFNHVHEELADVQIMMAQANKMFDEEAVIHHMNQKFKRLEARLADETYTDI